MQWPFSRKMTNGDWLADRVATFRKMGFYAADSALTDAQLAEKVRKARWQDFEDEIDPDDPIADLKILRYDPDRVWWQDMEAGVFAGSRRYEMLLWEWGKISRGAFQPQDIHETWESEQGPVHVAFMLDGKPQAIQPAYSGDYLDMGVLRQINKLMANTGLQLAQYDAFDQTAFVVVLTADEKRRLVKDRRWKFAF